MCAFAFVAQAQVRKFHYVDGGYWVKVDLNKKEFLPDGCGVDHMPIKKLQEGRQQGIVLPPDSGYTGENGACPPNPGGSIHPLLR